MTPTDPKTVSEAIDRVAAAAHNADRHGLVRVPECVFTSQIDTADRRWRVRVTVEPMPGAWSLLNIGVTDS